MVGIKAEYSSDVGLHLADAVASEGALGDNEPEVFVRLAHFKGVYVGGGVAAPKMRITAACHTFLGKGIAVVEGHLDGEISVFAVIVEFAKILHNVFFTNGSLFIEISCDGKLFILHPGMEKVHLRQLDRIKTQPADFVNGSEVSGNQHPTVSRTDRDF